jgi:HD-GYP domain-containing protein (c-di-GMP phosphodiesterase class II)
MRASRFSWVSIEGYVGALSMALNERDGPTRRHCDRVEYLASAFGRQCGLGIVECRALRLCARFHDIGKIGIPDRVLFKPGRLDAEEWTEMRSHSERGQRIVKAIAVAGVEQVALGVRHHHEHVDGGGYPDGLAGEDIPLIARMVSIIDAYDSMAMPRPYRNGQGHELIMATLRAEAGGKYDRALMSGFERVIAASGYQAPSN